MLKNIDEAVELLKKEHAVVLPTESVYGVFALNIDTILKVKPRNNKHCCIYLKENDSFLNNFGLYKKYLPGPLTIILNGQGYRCSSNKYLQEILFKLNQPLYGTSANINDGFPVTDSFHVDLNCEVFNGGRCQFGIESTVFSLDENKILRSGFINLNNEMINTPKYYHQEIMIKKIELKDFWYQIHENDIVYLPYNSPSYFSRLLHSYFFLPNF